jgi:hypothetical protein
VLPDDWNEIQITQESLDTLPVGSNNAFAQFIHDAPVEWFYLDNVDARIIRGPRGIINIIQIIFTSLKMVDPTDLEDGSYICIMWDRELNHWIEQRSELSHIVRAIYTPGLPELCNYESKSGLFPWEWPNYRSFHYELIWRYGGLGVYYHSGI